MLASSHVVLRDPYRLTISSNSSGRPEEGQQMASTDAQTGSAPVGGLNMYYEVHGTGSPLILLHGAYMTIDLMGPILPGLATTPRRSKRSRRSRPSCSPGLRSRRRTSGPRRTPATFRS
jgi:hypothetical protein